MLPQILQTIDRFLADPQEIDAVFDAAKPFGTFEREHLISWFVRFKAGIAYVFQKYGLVAEQFFVAEEIALRGRVLQDDAAYYIPDQDQDCIAITYKALAKACQGIAHQTLSTSPHLQGAWVSSRDFPFLQAVEEAYHSYYLKVGKGVVNPMPGQYLDDPVELAAGEVVRNAVKETGIALIYET